MPGVFDCDKCNERFYTDEDMIPHSPAVHIGYDDMDGYVESLYLCENCAKSHSGSRNDVKNRTASSRK